MTSSSSGPRSPGCHSQITFPSFALVLLLTGKINVVSGAEGKAGMACILDPDREVDLEVLYREASKVLASYAMPLFLRCAKDMEVTGEWRC